MPPQCCAFTALLLGKGPVSYAQVLPGFSPRRCVGDQPCCFSPLLIGVRLAGKDRPGRETSRVRPRRPQAKPLASAADNWRLTKLRASAIRAVAGGHLAAPKRLPVPALPDVGLRVDHAKHGAGTVVEHLEDGRARIDFDNGQSLRRVPCSWQSCPGTPLPPSFVIYRRCIARCRYHPRSLMTLSSKHEGKQTGARTFRRRFSSSPGSSKAHAASPEPLVSQAGTSASPGGAPAHDNAPGSSAAHAEMGDEAMSA